MSVFDRTVAPEATRDEIVLCVAGAAVSATLAAVLALRAGMSPLAVVVLVAIAADGFGGLVVNATGSNRRWFHGPGRTRRFPLVYVAAHLHPFVMALVVPGFSWAVAVVVYTSVLAAALVITACPSALRRPIAYLCAGVCIAVVAGLVTIPPVVSWFAPVLIVQLVLSHMLGEEADS